MDAVLQNKEGDPPAPKKGPRSPWVKAAWVGLLFCIALLMAQKLPLRWPRSSGFICVAGLIVFANVFWWAWVDGLLAQGAQSKAGRFSWERPARVIWWLYIATMLLPVGLMMVQRRWWDRWPYPVIVWILSWDLLLACLSAISALALIFPLIVRSAQRLVSRIRTSRTRATFDSTQDNPTLIDAVMSFGAPPTTPSAAVTRRRLLLGAAALPLAGTAATVIGASRQEGRFIVRHVNLKLPRLPDRLRGLTISHVSDMHTGRLFRPDHLPAMVDAVNALNSDLVMVTGDIIDHSNDFLPAACDALAQLTSRYGRYLVVGNHDLIDNSRAFVNYVQEHEPHLLIDKHLRLDIGGEKIQIAGLGWSSADERHRGDPGHIGRAQSALKGADRDLFTLAITHHPHAFDALVPHHVDLTLAGHTHGGQLMLTPPGTPLRLGAGSLMFRYIWGEYWKENSALFVNAGVGNWFPLRINAPAEIVQLRLI